MRWTSFRIYLTMPLFYNGPKCGASAPDHMHFQAGKKEEFPVVRN
ncbi:MAG: DUF4922 domain-containing protein [Parabacteroides merdae]